MNELVEITNSDGFIIDMQYPKLNMKNAIKKCLVRKEVLERLKIAKNNLPNGYNLKIWDAYRPISLQVELYNKYYNILVKEFNLENKDDKYKNEFINQFISIPTNNEYLPPHATGGAVDVTLVKNNKDINMGACFDEFTKRAFTSYYDDKDPIIKENRKILLNAMTKAGFTNLKSEFWHYDYGNINWSKITNQKTIYKRII